MKQCIFYKKKTSWQPMAVILLIILGYALAG
jgi:hypothetical protein